jgi:transcriptional regulator with XRE-family HTH domain
MFPAAHHQGNYYQEVDKMGKIREMIESEDGFRKVRLSMGLSVSAYAKRIKVSASTIRRNEANRKISLLTLAKILNSQPLQHQLYMFDKFTEDAKEKEHHSLLPVLEKLNGLIRDKIKKTEREHLKLAA